MNGRGDVVLRGGIELRRVDRGLERIGRRDSRASLSGLNAASAPIGISWKSLRLVTSIPLDPSQGQPSRGPEVAGRAACEALDVLGRDDGRRSAAGSISTK